MMLGQLRDCWQHRPCILAEIPLKGHLMGNYILKERCWRAKSQMVALF